MNPRRSKLLVLSKYGALAASARQRFLQFSPYCEALDIDINVSPLFDDDYLRSIMEGGAKPMGLALASYIRRAQTVLRRQDFDGLVVHCEVFPYVPSFLEGWSLPGGMPLIFDYDDAIFHQYDQHRSRLVRALLGGKLKPLLRRADLAICGNAYLENYAQQFCSQTEIVPTVVDTTVYEPVAQPRPERPVTIGWIGSPSTWAFVKPLVPLLSDLAERHGLRVRVVGAGPQAQVPPRFEFLPWSEAEEIALIQDMDIGIMPLPDEPWARGKCGYKLIQYMACGLPVIASPVGVNCEIVEHGENGFLASTPEDWIGATATLATSAQMRAGMGASGRRKVERAYSLAVHGPRLAEMMRGVIEDASSHRHRTGSS